MTGDDIKARFQSCHPEWEVFTNQYGRYWLVDIVISGEHEFVLEVAPTEEVGLTDRKNLLDVDFSGHDVAFPDLDSAIAFIEKKGSSSN